MADHGDLLPYGTIAAYALYKYNKKNNRRILDCMIENSILLRVVDYDILS